MTRLAASALRTDMTVLVERVASAATEVWALVDDVEDLQESITRQSPDQDVLRLVRDDLAAAWVALQRSATTTREALL